MKSLAKSIVLRLLERMVRWRLGKIHPKIIAVTGSVGKTSTKEAIFAVISTHVPSHRNLKSYNSEFGLFLSVLGEESGYSSPLKWTVALARGFFSTLMISTPPYKELIVEMGADKPGDIEYLLKHLHPTIGVLTNVKGVHLGEGQFENEDAILREKSKLVRALPMGGWAILNADDERVASIKEELRCNVITFGMHEEADLCAKHVSSGPDGLRFTLAYEGKQHAVHLPQLLGEHHVYVVLPAVATGFLLGMTLPAILEGLRTFALPPGRMSLIEGMNGSLILDSSYNASPETMTSALDILRTMPGRRFAALGSMNELGTHSEREHRRIGRLIPRVADVLVTVGESARYYGEEAVAHGLLREASLHFDSSAAAGEYLKNKLQKGDFLLVKGSQNQVRMERLVETVMAHPERAPELLVRQEHYWKTH